MTDCLVTAECPDCCSRTILFSTNLNSFSLDYDFEVSLVCSNCGEEYQTDFDTEDIMGRFEDGTITSNDTCSGNSYSYKDGSSIHD